MANQMNQKVVITTFSGFSVTADDAVKKGQGTAAAGALENHRDVYVDDGTNITYVPFKAVDHAVITKEMTTVADPDDTICPDPVTP